MKRFSLLVLIVFLCSCITENWDLNFNGKLKNTYIFDGWINYGVSSTILSKDGNILICGTYNENCSVIKTSVNGSLHWRKNVQIGNFCTAISLVQTPDKNIYVCGVASINWIESREDIFLLKLNAKGDSIWTKTFGGKEFDYASCIIATSDGNLLMAGRTDSFEIPSFDDIYVIKLNFAGEIIWEKTYPDPDSEFVTHILETPEGDYLLTGNDQASGPDTANKIYLLKIDSDGNVIWNKKFGSEDWKWAYSSVLNPDGEYLTCGSLTHDGYTQVLILRTDKNGNLIWEKTYGEPFLSEKAYSLKVKKNNTYTIVGSSFEVNNPDTEIIMFKIDDNGKELWFQKFGASSNSAGFNLVNYAYGNVITGNYDGKIFMSFLNDFGKPN